jgi:hypothetical protein
MYMYSHMYVFIYITSFSIYTWKTELTENTNFHLFAAKRNGKRKFVFLGLLMINGK